MSTSDAPTRLAPTDLIAAFAAARARGDASDLTDFLPRPEDPLYREARREILLLDLKFAWREGKRRLLLDYIGVFPDLREDRAAIEEVAFAEYRLRLSAGEDPSPAEYEWQYGVSASSWPDRVVEAAPPAMGAPADSELRTDVVPGPEQILTRILRPARSASDDADEAEPAVGAAVWLNQAMNQLPAVGTAFLSFQLMAELGRGSFGRVYLARQGDLAHRLVALKITVELGGEEQKLAQLQHTNVVPIYSFHQAQDLRAVCMPFFGATTLADVVRGLQIHAPRPESGKSLVNIVRSRRSTFGDRAAPRSSNDSGSGLPMPRPRTLPDRAEEEDVPVTLAMLEGITYVEAVLWLAERLAEGLSHAHEHGILHRDLKPANILLTDDGQPMLLDFNLSADVKPGAGLDERRVGGTFPYMAPEHLAAVAGEPAAVDERSDLYSLGVILFELLTGRLPFAVPRGRPAETVPAMIAERTQPPPRLRRWNPAISLGVESLVRHCLEPDPSRRYQSAQQLREDLKRQRQHRPLRHAAEPSLRERAQKWVRRHPRLTSPATLGAVTALVLALALTPVIWQTWQDWTTRNLERDEALVKAGHDAQAVRLDAQLKGEALEKFRNFWPKLAPSRPVMESVNAVQVLPKVMNAWVCEEKNLQKTTADCRKSLDVYEVLQRKDWQDQAAVRHLPDDERKQLRRDVSELLFVLAQAELVRATYLREKSRPCEPVQCAFAVPGVGLEVWGVWRAVMTAPLVSALDLNERARHCCAADAMPLAMRIQQAKLMDLLGNEAQAKDLWSLAARTPVFADSEDAYWTASALVADGEYKKALPLLDQVVKAAPDHYGAWLVRGACYFSLASIYDDAKSRQKALECFTTCVVMRPDGLWGYYNRGLVYHEMGLNQNALVDLDRVLAEKTSTDQPRYATAYALRAEVWLQLKRYEQAEEDFTRAIAFEPNVPEYYYSRAKTRQMLGKYADARLDEQHVLASSPSSAAGWTYRGLVRSAKDPQGALADFDEALAREKKNVVTMFAKARLLAQVLNRHREAVEVLDRALAIKPDFIEARIARGLANAVLGRRTSAQQDADAALRADSTPRMHYHVARVYALTSGQDPADALEALRLLGFALRHGFGVDSYRQETDLASLRNLPEFQRLGLGLKLLGVPP